MQSKSQSDVQLVLIYHLAQNGKDEVENIVKAVEAYQKITSSDVNIQSKDGKTVAIVSLSKSAANKMCLGKQIEVAGQKLHVRKWFSDFQIFINKLPQWISSDDVRNYFTKFGSVMQVEITDAHLEGETNKMVNRHCYIKLQTVEAVNKCLLSPKHIIKTTDLKESETEVKVVRTYGIGQSQESDKRIFIKIQPSPYINQAFEDLINEQFAKCGTLRERIRVQPLGPSSKATAIFTNIQSYQKAMATLNQQSIKDHTLTLRPFITKETSFRIFLGGVKPNLTEAQVEGLFQQNFGKIVDISFSANKLGYVKNCVVNFAEEKSFKRALAEYKEYPSILNLFHGDPFVTIHMNARSRKDYVDFNRKKNPFPNKTNYPPNQMDNRFQGPMNMMNPMMNPIPMINPMINPMANQMNPLMNQMNQFMFNNNNMIRPPSFPIPPQSNTQ